MSDEFQQIFQSELVDILGDCGNIEKLCELKNFLLQYLFNQDPVAVMLIFFMETGYSILGIPRPKVIVRIHPIETFMEQKRTVRGHRSTAN